MKYFYCLVLLSLISCAHHEDVRPMADGNHIVKIIGEDKTAITREAMDQANHFCKETKKYAAVIKEETKYIGSGSEEDYVRNKNITNAVSAVGGSAAVFGGKKEKELGGIGLIGGQAANAYLGNGFQTTITFVCK